MNYCFRPEQPISTNGGATTIGDEISDASSNPISEAIDKGDSTLICCATFPNTLFNSALKKLAGGWRGLTSRVFLLVCSDRNCSQRWLVWQVLGVKGRPIQKKIHQQE
jgi:hypothetical protein